MNNKKLLILLSVGLVSLLALTACGKKEDPGADAGSVSDTAADTESAGSTLPTPLPRYDYMTADVLADVDIQKEHYTGVTLTIPDSLRIEEEDVDAYIENIRFQYRTAENGSTQMKDQALKMGDDAFIYYKGVTGGEEFEGGSNWDAESPTQLGLGSGSFIPGFEKGLVGVIPSSTSREKPAEVKVTFPEEYQSAELAGKDATFYVYVEYAVQYKLPEYNRAFVEDTLKYESKKEFYASDRAFMDEFREYVRETLETQNESNVRMAKLDAIAAHLLEKTVCRNLPEVEFTFYMDSYRQEVEYYYEYYGSMGGEEFSSAYPDLGSFAVLYFNLEKGTDWEVELRARAEKMIKLNMITHAIGELEGIESVTDEELQAEIDNWVNYYYGAMTAEDVKQSMGMVALQESAYADKMDEWLLERFAFTYEDGSSLDGEGAGGETESGSETESTSESETDAATETVA